jgi:hypothetical protein
VLGELVVLFAVFVGLHLLARFVPAAILAAGRSTVDAASTRVPGRAARGAIICAGMVASLIAVALLLPTVSGWDHRLFDRDHARHSSYRQ